MAQFCVTLTPKAQPKGVPVCFYVHSADAKSFKKAHLAAATKKACAKAAAKALKTYGKPYKPVACSCVG